MVSDEKIEEAADNLIAGKPLTYAERRLLNSPQGDFAMGQVRASVYESAVKGRQDMRSALRIERDRNRGLVDLLKRADEAINPPDRSGISLEKWNVRLKAITAEIRKVTNEKEPK